jgi:hypothetical protein
MSEWPEADWSHSSEGHDTDGDWNKVEKETASAAFTLLELLSQDLAPLETDASGWTEADSRALGATQEFDWLARLLVPPDAVSAEHRMENMELMATFRAALPFAEAERNWLLDDHRLDEGRSGSPGTEPWIAIARKSETSLMSSGIVRVVRGRDLLERWWAWRRETGEYAGQGSLDQARSALEGVIGLLAPELGLPAPYLALRSPEHAQPMP